MAGNADPASPRVLSQSRRNAPTSPPLRRRPSTLRGRWYLHSPGPGKPSRQWVPGHRHGGVRMLHRRAHASEPPKAGRRVPKREVVAYPGEPPGWNWPLSCGPLEDVEDSSQESVHFNHFSRAEPSDAITDGLLDV